MDNLLFMETLSSFPVSKTEMLSLADRNHRFSVFIYDSQIFGVKSEAYVYKGKELLYGRVITMSDEVVPLERRLRDVLLDNFIVDPLSQQKIIIERFSRMDLKINDELISDAIAKVFLNIDRDSLCTEDGEDIFISAISVLLKMSKSNSIEYHIPDDSIVVRKLITKLRARKLPN